MKVLKQFNKKTFPKDNDRKKLDVIPDTVPELLKVLDNLFPPIVINPSTSINEIMFSSGKRSLINWIKFKLEDQNNR